MLKHSLQAKWLSFNQHCLCCKFGGMFFVFFFFFTFRKKPLDQFESLRKHQTALNTYLKSRL